MGLRLLSTKSIYRNLFVNTEMEAWVERQKPQTQDKYRKVSAVVLSDTNFWKNQLLEEPNEQGVDDADDDDIDC